MNSEEKRVDIPNFKYLIQKDSKVKKRNTPSSVAKPVDHGSGISSLIS